MKNENTLALAVAYYLSRFDEQAYRNLGYTHKNKAHSEIGSLLGVNPNSIKNMRDEYDPIHENNRAGWHQRPLRPSRIKILEAFQKLPEEELRQVVLRILEEASGSTHEDSISVIVEQIASPKRKKSEKDSVFVVRGPTGRKAEEYFIEYHRQSGRPIMGTLKDMRDMGCGFDFEIRNNDTLAYIEVKGINDATGGISFTSKEWETARQSGSAYYLVIVSNLTTESPHINIINNPATILKPRKSVIETVQIRWNVTAADLSIV